MELLKEDDIKFMVDHRVTEEKLLKLEKGVRKVGFAFRGRRILLALFGLGFMTLLIALLMGGVIRIIAGVVSGLSFLVLFGCTYSLAEGWFKAKREIHLQCTAGNHLENADWQYRFHEKCYEVIGKNEMARVRYSYVMRLMDFSGMLVLVEKGNVVRYFEKKDLTQGDGDSLAAFLQEKCGVPMEQIRV